MRSLAAFIFFSLLVPIALAEAPQPLPGGGVSCNPGCDRMTCGPTYCMISNAHGCAAIRRSDKIK